MAFRGVTVRYKAFLFPVPAYALPRLRPDGVGVLQSLVFLVVYDAPAPRPVGVDQLDPAALGTWCSRVRIGLGKHGDSLFDDLQRNRSQPRDTRRRHVDNPVRI